ncbi:MAG: hypothetical protein U0X92_15900 [Anaerolineales bacterium]
MASASSSTIRTLTPSASATRPWGWDPFKGKVEDELYARGACRKASTPGMIYGLAMARDLGLLDGWTAYYRQHGRMVMVSLPTHSLRLTLASNPILTFTGEPTKMLTYRGHKGRLEMKITSKANPRTPRRINFGDNAIYKLLPIIAGIRDLETATLATMNFGAWQDHCQRYAREDPVHQRGA